MSFSLMIKYFFSSSLISLPEYLAKTTLSPSATSISTRFLPSSSQRPGPTATIKPSCGFSLAVSGSRIPLAVFSSCFEWLHDHAIRKRSKFELFLSHNRFLLEWNFLSWMSPSWVCCGLCAPLA